MVCLDSFPRTGRSLARLLGLGSLLALLVSAASARESQETSGASQSPQSPEKRASTPAVDAVAPGTAATGEASAGADGESVAGPDAEAEEGVEDGVAEEGETAPSRWVTELILDASPAPGAWLEITPLAGAAGPSLLDFAEEEPAARLDPQTPQGPVMLCTGGGGSGSLCRRAYLYRGESARGAPDPDQLEIQLEWQEGMAVFGHYVMDDLPVAGAEVSVVPVALHAERPFLVPLARMQEAPAVDTPAPEAPEETIPAGSGSPSSTASSGKAPAPPRLVRVVETDEDGGFELPPLAPGHYLLETLLPTGRLHRGEPFELPAAADVPDQVERGEDGLRWPLGEISVTDWLAVEVQVVDQEGEPIEDAEVSARQGRSASTLVSFRGRSDAEGRIRLSGFDAEQPMWLECSATGHVPASLEFDLLPVDALCTLSALGGVRGTVTDTLSQIPEGAQAALYPPADTPDESATVPETHTALAVATVDVDGEFLLEVAPGEMRLALSAPGHQTRWQEAVLEAGATLDVGAIILAPGRSLAGRVVEKPKGRPIPLPLGEEDEPPVPIPGAEIRAVEPAGAAEAVADAEGSFTISAIGETPLVLEVTAEGYAPSRVRLLPREQRRQEPLVVEMQPGGWIRAVVSGEDPCAGCRLSLRPGGDMLTDGDGEALSPALLPGWYRVERPRLDSFGSTVVAVPNAESRRVRVTAGEISTVFFETDLPRIRVRFEDEPGTGWWLVARTPWGEQRVDAEADGSFLVPYRQDTTPELFLTRFDDASGHDLEVRVATLRVGPLTDRLDEPRLLPLPGGRLVGRVENEDTGLGGVRVRLQNVSDGAHAAEMRTAPDGRFELPHVPEGVYTLVLGERAFQFVTVGAREKLELGDFQLYENTF